MIPGQLIQRKTDPDVTAVVIPRPRGSENTWVRNLRRKGTLLFGGRELPLHDTSLWQPAEDPTPAI